MTYTRIECPECAEEVRPRQFWDRWSQELHIGCPNCGSEWRFKLADQTKDPVPVDERPVHEWGIEGDGQG